ncbi:ATP-grasp domain-containing protein [Bradyrhizobium sp. STM 3562]|uniref:ATP-grasp domain-containing protein n=1 Tax=Bradyrhizobium sp. STM 3562 TaxID=578924 RepID=UPI00388FDC0A
MSITFRDADDARRQRLCIASSVRPDEVTAETGRPTSAVPHILMLSTLYKLPYRVMRCAAATGAEVYVFGASVSSSLRHSRFCQQFRSADVPIDGTACEQLAQGINQCVAAWGIDLVLAGDGPASRTLIALRHRIGVPCFPMPDLQSFDLLNDKWQFYHLCGAAGVRAPDTWLFHNATELKSALEDGTLKGKLIAKPLSQSGGEGCVVLEAANPKAKLGQIDYAPVLVQQFIDGNDIGASVFCKRGVVKAFVAHEYRRDTYRTFADDGIRGQIEKLLRTLEVDGVFNFDMRRDADGQVHYLECNPRFFFKIAMSMLAGINFVALGLDDSAASDGAIILRDRTVRFPKALLCTLWAAWRIEAESWKALKFTLADPIPYLREEIGLEGQTSL